MRGAAALLRNGVAHFTVVGDGPERSRLEELASSLGVEKAVSFCGWVSHDDVLSRLRSADVMVFPTLRDNGAGVVFEALASGAVPVVADFGGPGDIVYADVGFKVPLTNESDMVSQIEKILSESRGQQGPALALETTRDGVCSGMPDLGCKGTEHYSRPELGCAAGPEARSSATKDIGSWYGFFRQSRPVYKAPDAGNDVTGR